MSEYGYIALHRVIQHHKIWQEKPFTRAQAWIDILLSAQFSDSSFWMRGIEVEVPRGCLAMSEHKMAERWGWSRGKVRRFMDWLETEQQIEIEKSNIINIIRILKYERYQKRDTKQDNRRDNRRDTYNKENNVNNSCLADLVDYLNTEYPSHRMPNMSVQQLLRANPSAVDNAEQVKKSLQAWLASEGWREQSGRFIPNLQKFIEHEHWKRMPVAVDAKADWEDQWS